MNNLKLLRSGEKIKHIQWQHPYMFIQFVISLWRIAAFVAAYVVAIVLIKQVLGESEAKSAAFAVLNIGLILMFWLTTYHRFIWLPTWVCLENVIKYFSARHIITNQRVLFIEGFFKKRKLEMALEDIHTLGAKAKNKFFKVDVLYFYPNEDTLAAWGIPYFKNAQKFMDLVVEEQKKLHVLK